MAKIVNTDYSGKFNLPIPVGRLNPTPLDSTEVWNTLEEAQNYASTGATSYVGQILYVKSENNHYVITNEFGTLKPLSNDSKEFVVNGYYLNDKFYTDSTYQTLISGEKGVIYIDGNSRQTFTFDGDNFTRSTPIATSEVPGIMKLYDEIGSNIDGTMTQRAISEGIQNGFYDEDDEVLILTHVEQDNMYIEKYGL